MSSEDQRKLIEWFLVRELHPEDEMTAIAERLGTRHVARLTTALFGEAMDRRYGARTPGPAELREFARHLADTYDIGDEPVRPLVVEAVIRAHDGEVDLLKQFPVIELMHHQVAVAYDIFRSLDLDEAGLDDFVNEVMALMDDIPTG